MSYESEVWALRNRLYSYAVKLTRSHDDAEDLLQITFEKAFKHKAKFQAGTNLSAWMFTMLRNEFLSQKRKGWRWVEDPDDIRGNNQPTPPNQIDTLALGEVWIEIKKLPETQQEALVLVAVQGFTYEETAKMMNTQEGTIKSRVSRARSTLVEALGMDFFSDPLTQTVFADDNLRTHTR